MRTIAIAHRRRCRVHRRSRRFRGRHGRGRDRQHRRRGHRQGDLRADAHRRAHVRRRLRPAAGRATASTCTPSAPARRTSRRPRATSTRARSSTACATPKDRTTATCPTCSSPPTEPPGPSSSPPASRWRAATCPRCSTRTARRSSFTRTPTTTWPSPSAARADASAAASSRRCSPAGFDIASPGGRRPPPPGASSPRPRRCSLFRMPAGLRRGVRRTGTPSATGGERARPPAGDASDSRPRRVPHRALGNRRRTSVTMEGNHRQARRDGGPDPMARSDLRIVPTGGPLGADAWGVDLERLSDDDFEVLHRAWLDHDGVLRIPGQFVPAETLLAFAARFGELDLAPINAKGDRELYRPGPAAPDRHLEHRRGRQGDRRARKLRVQVAHRHVLQRGAAEGQHPARDRDPGPGRRHGLRQHVHGVRDAARGHEAADRRAHLQARRLAQQRRRGAARLPAGLRAARGRAGRGAPAGLHASGDGPEVPLPRPPQPRLHPRASRRPRATPCSTSCGRTPPATSTPGTSAGASATSWSGTTAAPCTGATRWTRTSDGCSTARRSGASGRWRPPRPEHRASPDAAGRPRPTIRSRIRDR